MCYFSLTFPLQNPVNVSPLPHTCYMPRPSVTTAWRVLRLRKEERPPIWRVAANILDMQSRTTDKGWSCSLGGWARC
jgi:hypothetical protein